MPLLTRWHRRTELPYSSTDPGGTGIGGLENAHIERTASKGRIRPAIRAPKQYILLCGQKLGGGKKPSLVWLQERRPTTCARLLLSFGEETVASLRWI